MIVLQQALFRRAETLPPYRAAPRVVTGAGLAPSDGDSISQAKLVRIPPAAAKSCAFGAGESWGIGRLRVLLLTYDYSSIGGSAGVAAAALADGLAERGAVVDVVTTHPGDKSPTVMQPRPTLTIHRVLSRGRGVHEPSFLDQASHAAAAWPVVRRLIRAHSYDVAHVTFGLPTGLLLLPLLHFRRVPVILSLSGVGLPGSNGPVRTVAQRLARALARRIWRGADRVIVPSESVGRLARRTDPRLSYRVIRHGVDVVRFRPAPSRSRNAGPIRCLAVARLVERNGVQDLLRAFARLDRGRYRLEIVGDGPASPALRALATRLGLGQTVTFAGWLDGDALAARYRGADMLTLAAREGCLGGAYAEALASGLPIVGTAIGGIPEIVEEGLHGLLVPPGEPEALARAIRRLGGDAALRAEMAGRNRSRAVTELAWGATARRCLALYAEVQRRPALRASGAPLAVIR